MRIVVEVSESFHTQVKTTASSQGKSISDVVKELLENWLKKQQETSYTKRKGMTFAHRK